VAAAELTPVTADERIELLDVLRGMAICGILIGNMQWFSGYGMMPAEVAPVATTLDNVVQFLVHFVVEGKFYSIFSFLFGFGFAMQIARAEERGDTRAIVFKRRLFWLLVIGFAHGFLLWAGDILSVYAWMGFILLLFRRKPDRSLLKWAAWLVVVPVVTYSLLYGLFAAFAPADAAAGFAGGQIQFWNDMYRQVTTGSYLDIISGFNLQYIAGRYAGLVINMRIPKILAMLLLGVYAYRKGYFHHVSANRPFISKVAVYGLLLGVIGNLMMATLAGNEGPFPPTPTAIVGVAGYAFGVPALALGIMASVTLLWQSGVWRRLLGVLAPVGRMALTNYLLQTVVCVTIFYGYGFGEFGQHRAAAVTAMALGIFVLQVITSGLWLRFFAYGPMEWIWRQLTYKRRLPLVRGVQPMNISSSS
jgi:uncharacterized protein